MGIHKFDPESLEQILPSIATKHLSNVEVELDLEVVVNAMTKDLTNEQ